MFEKNDRIGRLLRHGIPAFKMEKWRIDRRMDRMAAEGVQFRTKVEIGVGVEMGELIEALESVAMIGGLQGPRDLEVPGRERNRLGRWTERRDRVPLGGRRF